MQYREAKNGEKLSILGYGCMRFSRKGLSTDVKKTEKEIMAAIEGGVNYFDTAFIYPGSEATLGQILEENKMRDKVYIATKLPQYLIGSCKAIEKYFQEELKRLRTTYVDFYLMHHLTDIIQWEKLENLGIKEWIEDKKKSGKIKNIGFSYHGNTDNFIKILNAYDWDFCQIQYNYLDENTQAGVKGLKAAAEKGLAVMIMEPLRGGKLVNMLPRDIQKAINSNERHWSPAQWGLRWLYNQKEVTVVLSGMNSLEMVRENVKTASEAKTGEFEQKDFDFIEQICKGIREKEKVGCTGCRYCMPCPQGVDIPGIFRCYNAMYTESKIAGRFQFFHAVSLTKEPSYATQCIECGKCEMHCPQKIEIRKKLKEADKALRPPLFKFITAGVRKFMLSKRGSAKKNSLKS